ncbi:MULTISPECIES: hypothetical protein [unclassified Streptomyces]|uniref:hypothetical protein n=1 Tax=unclassified Streptomyces TaxID=2593676 RepID=UPI0035E0ABA2
MNTVALRLPDGPGPVDIGAHAFALLMDAVWAGDEWDADQLRTVLGWGGRLAGPHLLADAWDGGLIDGSAVAAHIGAVWSGAEYPDAALGHGRWRELWRAAGFTRDGCPAELPGGPVELWRGSMPERRADWSWTTERAIAEEYAGGGFGRKAGRLYRTMAPAGALLGAYSGRGEEEYVIDTDLTSIELVEGDKR